MKPTAELAIVPWTDSRIYNELGNVESVSDRFSRSAARDELFRIGTQEIGASRVRPYVGVCLLHRHCDLPTSCHMVEREGMFDGRQALLTHPKNRLENSVPVTWKIVAASANRLTLLPLEFSTTAYAKKLFARVMDEMSTIRTIAALVSRLQLTELIGLTISRTGCLPTPRHDQTILVESTDVETSTNIVRWDREDAFTGRLLETSWTFGSVTDEDIRQQQYPKRCPLTCHMLQQCVVYSPGHAIEEKHVSGHWA